MIIRDEEEEYSDEETKEARERVKERDDILLRFHPRPGYAPRNFRTKLTT